MVDNNSVGSSSTNTGTSSNDNTSPTPSNSTTNTTTTTVTTSNSNSTSIAPKLSSLHNQVRAQILSDTLKSSLIGLTTGAALSFLLFRRNSLLYMFILKFV